MSDPVFLSRNELGMAPPKSISRRIDPSQGGVMSHWGGPAQRVTTLDSAVSTWLAWQRMHMRPGGLGARNGGSDIGYNIGYWQSYIFAGRGAQVRSGANGTNDANTRYVAVVWIGGSGEEPTDEDYETFNWIVEDLRSNGAGREVKHHGSVRPTSCSGPHWTPYARLLDNKPVPDRVPSTPDTPRPPAQPSTTWTESLVQNLPLRRRRTDLGRRDAYDARIQGLLVAAGELPLQPNIERGTNRLDGKFGPSTEQSVRNFQRKAGIGVDGIVGRNTWTKLLGR